METQIGVLLALALPVVAAGCGATVPDPIVESSSLEQGTLESLIGNDATVTATVLNNGSAGEVEVTAQFLDSNEVVLGEFSETANMKQGERRRFSIDVEIPENSQELNVTADAAN
ncbi:MAG: hypothetical protein H8Z69_04195 [Nanohaloarchaea archaeon]|nr:hypothetical protein [Candidatus Nanohaloarchaea archaeon]